jgi:hypothetical protein
MSLLGNLTTVERIKFTFPNRRVRGAGEPTLAADCRPTFPAAPRREQSDLRASGFKHASLEPIVPDNIPLLIQ